MKKLFITTLIVFAASFGFSQKCKYRVDKKDAITEVQIKETEFVFLNSFNTLRFSKEGDTYYIYNQFHVWGQLFDVVKKDQEFILKLSNGDLLKFFVLEDNEGNRNVTGTQVYTRWDLKCKVTKEQMELISKSLPIALSTLSFTLGKGNAIEVSGKAGKTLSKYASCLLQ